MEPAKNTTAFWNRDYFKLISTKSFNGLKLYAQLYIMALTALNPGHKIMIWNMLCYWLIQNVWENFGKYEEHPFWSISISTSKYHFSMYPNTLQLTSSAGEGIGEESAIVKVEWENFIPRKLPLCPICPTSKEAW